MNKFFIIFIFVAFSFCNAAVLTKKNVYKGFLPDIAMKPKLNIQLKNNAPPCNANQFLTCTTNLAKGLNMSDIPDNAMMFMVRLDAMILQGGKPEFEGVCKVINDYVKCLRDTYDSCLSTDQLMKFGLDDIDATIYATLAQQLRYTCGPAYQTFLNHFDCMLADLKGKTHQIVNCIEQFNNSVYSDPAKICQTAQTFIDCYEDIFSDCGADMTTALCESMIVGFSVNMAECTDFTCNDKRGKLPLKKKLTRVVA